MAMDHTNCTHPRTPAGRAACRKAGGPGQVSTPTQAAPKATTPATRTPGTKTTRKARTVDLGGLPNVFTTVVRYARELGLKVSTVDRGDQRLVELKADHGTLILAWSPATPHGVNAVSWRPFNTSVATKIATVNDGLAKLKGE